MFIKVPKTGLKQPSQKFDAKSRENVRTGAWTGACMHSKIVTMSNPTVTTTLKPPVTSKLNHVIYLFFTSYQIKSAARCNRTMICCRHQPQALPRRPQGGGGGVSRRRGELGGRAELLVGRGEHRAEHRRRPRARPAAVIGGGDSVRRRRCEQHRAVLAAAGADGHVADGAAGRPVAVAGPAEVARLVDVVVVEVAELGVPAQAARARQPHLGRRRARPRHLLQQVGAPAPRRRCRLLQPRGRGARVVHGRGDDLAEQLDARRAGARGRRAARYRHLDMRQHVARGRGVVVTGSVVFDVSEGAVTYY
jgi:hypothetical protein